MTIFELNKDKEEFWIPVLLPVATYAIEKEFKDSILKTWYVHNVAISGEEILLKWKKRPTELTQEEVERKYR